MKITTVIVDDEEMDRYIARRYLSKRPEFGDVIEAKHGTDFLENVCDSGRLGAVDQPPILVLMDINMPGPDGFETVRALQARIDSHRVPPSIVVMMFTSSDNPKDKDEADTLSLVKGYITKPIDDGGADEVLALYRQGHVLDSD